MANERLSGQALCGISVHYDLLFTHLNRCPAQTTHSLSISTRGVWLYLLNVSVNRAQEVLSLSQTEVVGFGFVEFMIVVLPDKTQSVSSSKYEKYIKFQQQNTNKQHV